MYKLNKEIEVTTFCRLYESTKIVNMVRGCILFFLMLTSFALRAQDFQFSQFFQSHQLVNPALIGVFDGQYRFGLQYRNQWPQILHNESYQSTYGFFDAKINTKNKDFISYGIDLSNDRAGASRFTTNTAGLSIGYIKKLGRTRSSYYEHFLTGGFKIGIGQMSLSSQNLWFGNQFDKNTGNINLDNPSGEPWENNLRSKIFPDFSMGLYWFLTSQYGKSIYVGLASYHLNSPLVGLIKESNSRLKRKYSISLGGEVPISNNLSVLPQWLTMIQRPSLINIVGGQLRYHHRDWNEIAMRLGVFNSLVNNDSGWRYAAIIVSTIFEYKQFNIGFSYDINTSGMNISNVSAGTFEMSLQYVNRDTRYRKTVNCPRM